MTCHICGTKLKTRDLHRYIYEDWELYCPHCSPEKDVPIPDPRYIQYESKSKPISEEELKRQNLNLCLNEIRGYREDIKWGLRSWEQADAEFGKKMKEMGLI